MSCACELRSLHLSAVSLYNGSLFKPWYLSGQVEVYCLTSSMWPESGTYAADRGLCPVSDWGLGLVTGPQFYPLAAYPPTHTPPPPPPPPRRGESLMSRDARGSGNRDGPSGCPDTSMDYFPVRESTQRPRGPHTNTQRSSSCSLSPELSHPGCADSRCHAPSAQWSLLVF